MVSFQSFVKVVAVVLFIVPGLLSLLGAILGSSWLMESRGVASVRSYLGGKGTKLFYTLLGIALIIAGVVILLDPQEQLGSNI